MSHHPCGEKITKGEIVYAADSHDNEVEFVVKVDHVCSVDEGHVGLHRCLRWKCDTSWPVSNHE